MAVDARQELDLRVGAVLTRYLSLRYQKKFNDLREQIISYGILRNTRDCTCIAAGFLMLCMNDARWLASAVLRACAGPCQFPTLGFVVDRHWYIENFISEPFWSIKVTAQKDGSNVSFTWKRGRLFDRLACFILYEQCINNPNAIVIKVNGKPVRK
jgi:DNA topoisomerase III